MSDMRDKMIENMNRLKEQRARFGKKSKSTKLWHKAFDDMYGERVKNEGRKAIEEIFLEQTGIDIRAKLEEIDQTIKKIEADGGDSEFEQCMYEELEKTGGKK